MRHNPGRRGERTIACAFVTLSVSVALAATASAQVSRVSVTQADAEANGASRSVSASSDGRYVAFVSAASNLVADDTNGVDDVFVKDRQTGVVTRVSVGAGGAQATAASSQPHIADGGRFVAFTSLAALVPEDANACPGDAAACEDVYVHDLDTHVTTLASVTPGGSSAMRGRGARISGNGRLVVFSSPSSNLAAEPAGVRIFIRDLTAQTTERLTVAGALVPSEGLVGGVSADGQVIAFGAHMNLLPDLGPFECNQSNGCLNAYVHARVDGTTRRLPVQNGDESSHSSDVAPIDISADGRLVLVASTGTGVIMPEPTALELWDWSAMRAVWGGASTPGNVAAGTVPAALDDAGTLVARCVTASNGGQRQLIVNDLRTTMDDVVQEVAQGVTPACATAVAISANGRWLFAASDQATLVPNDLNGASDVFLFDRDGDADGIPSGWERTFAFDPADPADAALDPDNDGLTNLQEFQRVSHPRGVFTRYFAEGASNAFFETEFATFNPGTSPAQVLVRHVGAGGSAWRVLHTLAPGEGWREAPSNAGPAPEATFSTIVESDQPLVAERSMRWPAAPGRIYGAHGETAITAPRTEWHFAEGATGVYSLFYLLLNPNDTAAHVTVRYFRPAPAAPVSVDYTIAANSRLSIDVNAQPGLAVTEVGAMVTSDVPILAERSQYLSTSGQFWAAGHAGAAVPAPATEWFVAEGATGFFQTYLVIANPGDVDAPLTVAYLLPDGTKIEKPYTAGKSSRLTIDVAGQDPSFAATTMSMTVRSDNAVPVVVERVMWWPAGAPYEAAVSAGATSAGTDWAAAHATIAFNPEAESTYLLIANPSDQAGTVTIRFGHRENRPLCSTTRDLLPHSRMTIDTRDICNGLPGGEQTITVRSDAPPIVVERATYWNSLRFVNGQASIEQMWAAGEAVALTPIAPLPPPPQ